MKFKRVSVFGVLLTIGLMALGVMAPCPLFAAAFTVHSVSTLDPNPYGLTITSNTTNVSATPGGTGLTLSQFQTLMQGDSGAFAQDNGGVLDAQQVWQGGSFPANGAGNNNGATMGDTSAAPITVTYGATQANTMQFWRDVNATQFTVGIDSNINEGTSVVSGGGQSPSGGGSGTFNFATGIFNDSTDTSAVSAGGGYIGIQGSAPLGLVFNNPAVGTPAAPVSNITAWGITQIPRGAARQFEVVATFSGGTTFDTGPISYTTTGADFVGIQAPAGQTITRIDMTDNGSGVSRFDDMAFVTSAPADTGGWKLTSGASWNSTGSWATGVIPNAQGASASFRDALTTSGNVALDGNKTVGQVVFVNPNASYTITPGSGGSLTIDNTGGTGTAAISTSGGNQTIAVPVILANASTQLYADLNTTLTMSNNISDTSGTSSIASGITKLGAGTVLLSGTNTYTGTTTVGLGTLDVASPSALPGYNVAAKVIVSAGGTLAVSVGGAGQWTSTGIDTLLANATFAVHQIITPSRLGFDTTGGNFTYGSNISGTEGIDKIGNNTLTLSGSNTYTGPTRILGGTLSVSSISGNLGVPVNTAGDSYSGVISMGSGATGATLKYTGTGETNIRIIDMSSTTGGATLDQSGTGNLDFGTLAGLAGTTTLASSHASVTASGAGNKTLTLQGSTSGTGEIDGLIIDHQTTAGTFSPAALTSILKTGTGKWTLGGTNTYTGTTTINQGTLALGITHSIDTTSTVVLGGGTLNTGGFDQFSYGSTKPTLTVNSSSVLDLGVGGPSSGSVAFANSAGLWQAGATLTVDDWVNGKDHLYFGIDSTGLTNSGSNTGQLAQINFVGFGPGAQILPSGEIEPLNPGSVLIPHDVNGDGHVDAADALALEKALANIAFYKTHYGPSNLTLNNDELVTVLDQNNDGQVDNSDVQALLINLTNGQGSTSAVPEPSTFLLLMLGAVPMLRRYRRRMV